jgi:hypothetical protein
VLAGTRVVIIWQLAAFASDTNSDGGDITPQLLMSFLALLQVPLFGLAVGAGVLDHFARPPR